VSLFVKNVNDNVPVFKQKIYTFSAPLSTRRFTALGQVSCPANTGDSLTRIKRSTQAGSLSVLKLVLP
jgi:hypothetical protein